MNQLAKTQSNELVIIKEQVRDIKTLNQVVRISEPILAENRKDLLIQMLIDLNKFSNVSRKMNDSQIAETVNNMLIEYPKISLQEYEIFFRRIRTGFYGQLYDSLDGIKIMAFLRNFYPELVKAYYDFKEEDHRRYKEEWKCRDIYLK